jgi:hypothetical protein
VVRQEVNARVEALRLGVAVVDQIFKLTSVQRIFMYQGWSLIHKRERPCYLIILTIAHEKDRSRLFVVHEVFYDLREAMIWGAVVINQGAKHIYIDTPPEVQGGIGG